MLLPVLADDTISYWHSLSFGKRKKIPQQLTLNLQPLVLCLHSANVTVDFPPHVFVGCKPFARCIFGHTKTCCRSFYSQFHFYRQLLHR